MDQNGDAPFETNPAIRNLQSAIEGSASEVVGYWIHTLESKGWIG